MATKKEGAQRILDAHASSKTVRRRLLPVAIGIVLVGGGVSALTSWQFWTGHRPRLWAAHAVRR